MSPLLRAKACGHPGHPLIDALEPFLYIEAADPVTAWQPGTAVRVCGWAVVPDGVACGDNVRSVREAFCRQAEDAIAAAEAAGCVLLTWPEIRLHGRCGAAEVSVELVFRLP